jgi:hypothetical protein
MRATYTVECDKSLEQGNELRAGYHLVFGELVLSCQLRVNFLLFQYSFFQVNVSNFGLDHVHYFIGRD